MGLREQEERKVVFIFLSPPARPWFVSCFSVATALSPCPMGPRSGTNFPVLIGMLQHPGYLTLPTPLLIVTSSTFQSPFPVYCHFLPHNSDWYIKKANFGKGKIMTLKIALKWTCHYHIVCFKYLTVLSILFKLSWKKWTFQKFN